MEYLVVIEKGESSFGAYVPDLPGLGVVGRTVAEVKRLAKQAIELHVSGLREDGQPIPRPTARSFTVTTRGTRRNTRAPRARRASRAVLG